MKMKKLIVMLLTLAMVFSLAACGNKNDNTGASVESKEATSESPAASKAADASKAPEESDKLTLEEGKLKVGMEIGYPPFEYFDTDGSTPIGFDVQLGKALADKLGLEVDYVDTAWDGIFAGLNTDKYDVIISAVTITPERLEEFNFTKPYIGNAQALVLLKDTEITAKSLEECAGLKVGYQAETTTDYYMTKLKEEGLDIKEKEYEKVINVFDDLDLGRIDAIVCDSVVALDYVNAENSKFQIVWQGTADETFGVCIKKGNDALTAKLDAALAEIKAEGKLTEISMDIFKMDLTKDVK